MSPLGPHKGLILVTRPQPEATATVSVLEQRGWPALAAPLLRVLKVPAHLPSPRDVSAVVLGSINAARFLPLRFRATPLLAVGDATAEAARARGFRNVVSAAGDARDLAALASRRCDTAAGPLLLATARDAGRPLATDLRARGFRVHRRVTYAVLPEKGLPQAAVAALHEGRVGHVAFFSASAATAFARIIRAGRLADTGLSGSLGGVTALALSPAVAAAFDGMAFRAVLTARRPDQESLLALLRGQGKRGKGGRR